MTVSAQINILQCKDFLKICYIKGVILIFLCVGGCSKFFRGLRYFEEVLFLGGVYQKIYSKKDTLFNEFLREYDPIPLLIAQHAINYINIYIFFSSQI